MRALGQQAREGTLRSEPSPVGMDFALHATSTSLLAIVLFLLVCFGIEHAHGQDDEARALWAPGGDPLRDALQTWVLGPDFFPRGSGHTDSGQFVAIDGRVRDYLLQAEHGRILPPYVRLHIDPMRSALYRALLSGNPVRELHALVVLMRSHTSNCVPSQWRVLEAVTSRTKTSEAMRTLAQLLNDEFRVDRIQALLHRELATAPLKGWSACDEVLWAVGAAGVIRAPELLPLLKACVTVGDSYLQTAVVVALARFQSHEARQVMVRIAKDGAEKGRSPGSAVAIWQLARVAPEELRRALAGTDLDFHVRMQMLFALAAQGHRDPVPEICDRLFRLNSEEFKEAMNALDAVRYDREDEAILRSAAKRLPAAIRSELLEIIARKF